MRNRWLALLAVLLLATLAGAWYALAPDNALPALPEDAARDTTAGRLGSPSCNAGRDEAERSPIAPATRSETGEESAGPADTRTPARDSQPPTGEVRGTPQPETPSSARPGESSSAGEAPASPAPAQRFIRGHTRPAHQNLGNTRPRAVKLQAKGIKSPGEISEQLKQDRRGLYAQYFNLPEGTLSETLPDKPSYTRIDRQLYFPDAESFNGVPVGDSFAAEWTGFLVIEQAADYWLFWGADNGGRVELAGQTVLLQDGMVRYVEVSTVLTLQPGLYPLTIEFAQFNNGVADWKKAAASFMWVPQGETKPVPVPPEMLLLPEWMWSDHAPIITGLSKSAGEIGDEITIEGKNFGRGEFDNGTGNVDVYPKVSFAGQAAQVLACSDNTIVVKVPIGAQTGDVIVRGRRPTVGFELPESFDSWNANDIPSNSAPFRVTTRFGLLAEWYGQSALDEPSYDAIASAVADVSRIESPPTFLFGHSNDQPFSHARCCAVWRGQLGLPAGDWMSVTFSTGRPLRVTLDGEQRSSESTQDFHWEFDSGDRLVPIVIEMLGDSDMLLELTVTLRMNVGTINIQGNNTPVTSKQMLPHCLLFPPRQPSAPPVVWSVANAAPDPWKPPLTLPVSSRPSVAVGEPAHVTVQLATSQMLSPLTFALDGIAMPAEFVESKDVLGGWHVTYSMVVPVGVGEGKLTATQGGSTSEPYLIDIANRGLIGFYYDFPQPSGLAEIPDLGPLACFAIRKDTHVRFESVADFDLPFPAETFVIEWFSSLIVEIEGDYVFTGRTDDGMRLWLNGTLIIDANRLQAPAENSSAPVHLKPGVYPLRMQYFENNQHEVCVLEWRATTGAEKIEVLPRQVIPAKAFSLDALPVLPARQATGKRTDGS